MDCLPPGPPVLVYKESLMDMEFDLVKTERPTIFDWPNLASCKTIPSKSMKLDSIIVLGKSCNIIEIDGIQELLRPEIIYVKGPTAYTGMYDNLKSYSLIFEINLVHYGGLTLSAILCTKTLSKLCLVELDAGQIEQRFRKSITDTIMKLPRDQPSRIEMGYRYDDRILIHVEDWCEIGLELPNMIKENFKDDAPIQNPDVYFIAMQEQIGISCRESYVLRNLKTENSLATVIGCKFEYHVDGHILWWKTSDLQEALNMAPEGGFQRVAALPGLGNGEFYLRNKNITYMEYRTRLFDEIRRDNMGILEGNKLIVLIAELCNQILHMTNEPNSKPVLSKDQEVITTKQFLKRLEHCMACIPSTVPATMLAAFKATATEEVNVSTLQQVIAEAFQFVEKQNNAGKFGEPINLLHAMSTSLFHDRHITILNILSRSLTPITDYLECYNHTLNLFDIYTYNMDYGQISIVFIVNAILRLYFYGTFNPGFPYCLRRPLNLTSQNFWVPTEVLTADWPFQNVHHEHGAIIPHQMNCKEIPFMSTLLCNKETVLLEDMRRQMGKLKEYALSDSNHSDFRELLSKYYKVLLEFILLVSLDEIGVDCESQAIKGMLALMWNSRAQREPIRVYIDGTKLYGMLVSGMYNGKEKLDQRFDIPVLAVNELIVPGREQNELMSCFSSCVETLMQTHGFPLKILTGNVELVVLPNGLDMLTKGGVAVCWKKAFNSTSKADTSKHPALRFKVNAIFRIIEDWLTENRLEVTDLDVDNLFDMIAAVVTKKVTEWDGIAATLLEELSKIHDSGSLPHVALDQAVRTVTPDGSG